jgi:photosystem I subunit 10
MISSPLLAVAARSSDWGLTVGILMLLSIIVAIAIAKNNIDQPNVGAVPPSPELFGGFSIGAIIGTMCFGHILGAGVILGLSNMGVL